MLSLKVTGLEKFLLLPLAQEMEWEKSESETANKGIWRAGHLPQTKFQVRPGGTLLSFFLTLACGIWLFFL